MQPKNTSSDSIAAFLWKFLQYFSVFFAGYFVAHLESVQQMESDGVWGIIDNYLANPHDRYDTTIAVGSKVPHALEGGAVLIGPEFNRKLALLLLDERGSVLHRWDIENRLFNPDTREWWKDLEEGKESSIDDAHLLPGGDVVFIQGAMSVNNYRGQRLARMDRNSRILWQVPGNFHHFIDIGGEPKTIYALSSRLRKGSPEVAAPTESIRFLEDFIEAYSPEGRKIGEWSIADAFEHSPYRPWLSSFEISIPIVQRIRKDGRELYDLYHVNSVQYLDAAKAKALPQAKEGDLLLSFRTMNALAVFRPSMQQIVWATKGPWKHQHSALVGSDGKLYMYDNEGRGGVALYTPGMGIEQYLSRILRFDPFTNRAEEVYAPNDLFTYFKGNYQHLSNGSWILTSPVQGEIRVVSRQGDLVWQLRTDPSYPGRVPHRKQLSFMHYYPAQALGFLAADKEKAP